MRGLVTAFPFVRPGLPAFYKRASIKLIGHIIMDVDSPTGALPPTLYNIDVKRDLFSFRRSRT